MARGAIKVPIAGDTSGFDKAIANGIIEPLEDAEKAFKDLERTAERADLDDSIKDAQKATQKLDSELEDTRAELDKLGFAARNAGDDARKAGADGEKGFRNFGDATAEVGDEIRQNLGETFSSFRGDLEDLPQIAQDTLGGLAGSGALGGLPGLFVTAAGAAGLGMLIGGMEQAQEEAEEFRAKVRDMSEEMIDTAGVGKRSFEGMADEARELVLAGEDGEKAFEDIKQAAKDLEAPVDDVVDAYLEGGPALQKLIDKYGDLYSAESDLYNAAEARAKYSGGAHAQEMGRLAAEAQKLKERQEILGEATEADREYTEHMERYAIKAELIDSVSDAYDGARDAALDAATADDGVLDVSAWAASVEEHKKLVESYKANLDKIKLTPEQWANLMELPESSRMQIAESLAKGPEDAKPKIIAALTDAGASAGTEAQVSFESTFAPETDVDIEATVSTTKADSELKKVTADRTAKIKVKVEDAEAAQKKLDDLAKSRSVNISVSADTSTANSQINSFRWSQSNRPIYVDVITRYGKGQLT